VHHPELALRSGCLGRLGCETRVRVTLGKWEVAEYETEPVPEILPRSLHDGYAIPQ